MIFWKSDKNHFIHSEKMKNKEIKQRCGNLGFWKETVMEYEVSIK